MRAFAQTLAVAGVVSAIVVVSIGENIARGLGLVGALTVIRFRSNLNDPRDLIFAFASLAIGVAVGAHAFVTAILGTAVFLGAIALVSRPWFAKSENFNAILSLRTPGREEDAERISKVLRDRCDAFMLVRVRQADMGLQEHAYQIRLKQLERQNELIHDIEQIDRIENALLVAYEGGVDA